ncbi:hypothetical protein [Rhizobium sp.]|uniref:hypothetical protein n=1 Tax=Rhizobium sp. TaxID=391 RepID=UPI002EF5C9BE
MANFVVFGIPGDSQLYLADIGAGTISPLSVPAGSDLGVADQLRNAGATIIKGVNLAIAVGSTAGAGSGRLDDAAAGGRLDESAPSGRLD